MYLATVMTIHATALVILPFSRRLGTLLTITCLHGLFGGFQDTATNLRMIIMHGQEVCHVHNPYKMMCHNVGIEN